VSTQAIFVTDAQFGCSLDSEVESSPTVPALHVLCYRVQSTSDNSPTEELASVRDDLIKWIANEALGGDDVAAEWLLLELSAKVSVILDLSRQVRLMQDTGTIGPPHSCLLPSLCHAFLCSRHRRHHPHYLPFTMCFPICYRSTLLYPFPWIF
jgi:hypothetical protein